MTTVADVMTTRLTTCPSSATIAEVARQMRDGDIGDVLLTGSNHQLAGIVTDRDLVVRALADGADANARVESVCSGELRTIGRDASLEDAARLMREQSLRRLPVVDQGRAIGIVTLGDLAIEREPGSALGDISAAPPNR